ncbi:hypothetical protein [Pantoea sp. BAV 3049]|uniref:hypothetical protein n=1 Tax=Pantoea sp. BAV 3049 TaxID=2654188 RepID=UPI0018EF0A66|nr:hypothetical protein [Pantoea sp. BAV 3049]
MDGRFRWFSCILDRCRLNDLAHLGIMMHLETLNPKPQQQSKIKERYCKGKKTDEVIVPDSWGLSELQRSFIDSMIDKKSK